MRLTCSVVSLLLIVAARATYAQPPAELTKNEAQQGFVSLFDGKTLDGWQGATDGYAPRDGKLVCLPGGNLFTANQYADFIFRFEFKLPPKGNNGVAIRSPLKGNPAYDAMEIQILDNSAVRDRPHLLKPYQYHGSIYGVVPAKRGHLKPVGEWNSEEITCKGPQVKVTLNGAVIVDADLSTIGEKTMDGRPHPGLHNKKGYIGFLGHGAKVEFRNLRVKEL